MRPARPDFRIRVPLRVWLQHLHRRPKQRDTPDAFALVFRAWNDAKIAPIAPVVCRGLIDSGAMCTAIDPTVLAKVAFPKNKVPVHTPSTGATPHMANVCDVSLYLHHPGHQDLEGSHYTLGQELAVTESTLLPMGIEVLIGMDVLSRCLFLVDGPGQKFTLGI